MDWIRQNKMRNWLIVGLFGLNVLTVSIIWMQTAKRYEPPTREEGARAPESVNLMKKALDLNEGQTKKIENILTSRREQSRDYDDRLAELKKELAEELFKENPDTSFAKTKAAEIGDLQSKTEMIRFHHFRDLLAICTPEQREKLRPIVIEVFGRKPPKDEPIVKKQHSDRTQEQNVREMNLAERKREISDGRPEGQSEPPSPPSIDDKLAKYSERLTLTDRQAREVRELLLRTRQKGEQLRKKVNPDPDEIQLEKKRIRKEENESIMKILNAEQKQQFEKMISNQRK